MKNYQTSCEIRFLCYIYCSFKVTLKMIPRIDYTRMRGLAKSAEVL